MFVLNHTLPSAAAGAMLAMLMAAVSGCSTFRPLPPADLRQPGWTIRQGQGVWRLPASNAEIAGEVVLATRPEGRAFVQFSKAPFVLVSGQETPRRWSVEFPPQNKHYAAPGKPPKRIIWLQLPRLLMGQPPPKGWLWQQDATHWRLENPANHEMIEGYFGE
jgi:hypothetical protein